MFIEYPYWNRRLLKRTLSRAFLCVLQYLYSCKSLTGDQIMQCIDRYRNEAKFLYIVVLRIRNMFDTIL